MGSFAGKRRAAGAGPSAEHLRVSVPCAGVPQGAGDSSPPADGAGDRGRGELAGVRGVVAIGEFASRLTQSQLSAVSAFFSPSLKRYVAPSRSSIHRILTELDPELVDRAVRGFVCSGSDRCETGRVKQSS